MSTEDGEICLSRSSPVKSEANAHTRVSVYSSWAWSYMTLSDQVSTYASKQKKLWSIRQTVHHLIRLKAYIIDLTSKEKSMKEKQKHKTRNEDRPWPSQQRVVKNHKRKQICVDM